MPDICAGGRDSGAIAAELCSVVEREAARWLAGARWLQRKDVPIIGVKVRDLATIARKDGAVCALAVLGVRFLAGDDGPGGSADLYNVPLVMVPEGPGPEGEPLAAVEGPGYRALVYDATATTMFARAALGGVRDGARVAARHGVFEFHSVGPGVRGDVHVAAKLPDTSTNTLVVVDSTHVMKVYRRMVRGTSPDLEMSVNLTNAGFRHMPSVTGYAVYRPEQGGSYPVLLVQQFIPNEGEAWRTAFADASAFIGGREECIPPGGRGGGTGRRESEEPEEPEELEELDGREERGQRQGHQEHGGRREQARQARLGEITAELHSASADIDDDAFRSESFGAADITDLEKSLVAFTGDSVEALRRAEERYEQPYIRRIRDVIGHEEDLVALVRRACGNLASSRDLGKRIRIHGDLHLGQFLRVAGGRDHRSGRRSDDFVMIDFEGEPLRLVEERRRKASPLRDVAGMLRSFDYVACSAAFAMREDGKVRCRGGEDPCDRARIWGRQAGRAFLSGYLGRIRRADGGLVPGNDRDFGLLLTCFKLEKALYEVRYELGNRPAWVEIPLAGVLDCLEELRGLVRAAE